MQRLKPRALSNPARSGSVMVGVLFSGILVACGLYAVSAYAAGTWGVIDVKATQVGVRVNYLTGTEEVVEAPGYQLFFPYFQGVFLLDKSPVQFQMAGDMRRGHNEVPFLLVRSKDGSNFWFESLEIQYELIPSQAGLVLSESGSGDGYKAIWLRALARSILRDEFGRFRAEDIADPTTYEAAKKASQAQLSKLLAPHGIHLIAITTPKPRFEGQYESVIEDRKVAVQEIARLKGEMRQLGFDRERLLARVEKEMSIEREKMRGSLAKKRLSALGNELELRAMAEIYADKRMKHADAERANLSAMAQTRRTQLQREAEGLRAQVRALEDRGELVVREALIKSLAKTELHLSPMEGEREYVALNRSGSRRGTNR